MEETDNESKSVNESGNRNDSVSRNVSEKMEGKQNAKMNKIFVIKAHEKINVLPDDADLVYLYIIKAHEQKIKFFKRKFCTI